MPPPLWSVRRATAADIDAIRAVCAAANSSATFGDFDASSSIETNTITLVAVDDNDAVVGVVSASDRVDGIDFEPVTEELQGIVTDAVISAGNALAVRALGIHPIASDHTAEITALLLRSVFAAISDLDHLVLLKPGGLYAHSGIPSYLENTFHKAPVRPYGRSVYLCPRQAFVPTLYVRPARVEDHDDLGPIFSAQSEVVSDRFGEFFLAEVIENQSEKQKVLVGEGPEGRAVGLLAFTSEVQTPLLQACFETAPFGYLVKRSAALEARSARAAVLESRKLADWYSVLSAHGEELQGVFDAIPPANLQDERVDVNANDSRLSPGDQAGSDGVMAPLSPDTTLSPGEGEDTFTGAAATEGVDGGSSLTDSLDSSIVGMSLNIHGSATPANRVKNPSAAAAQQQQGDEIGLPAVDYDSGEERVYISDVAAVFDAKGDAWGYTGIGGARLGHVMLVETGLLPASIEPNDAGTVTRSTLNNAVAAFADRRDGFHRRMRVSSWYTTTAVVVVAADDAAVPSKSADGQSSGRKLVIEEFDRLAASIDQERKEALRNAQLATTAAQRDLEAAQQAERAAHEAAVKEQYDREHGSTNADVPSTSIMKGKKAGAMAPAATSAAQQRRNSVLSAEKRAEYASAAVVAAQAALTQTLKVPMAAIAAAISKRVGRAANGSLAGEELVAELQPYLIDAVSNSAAAAPTHRSGAGSPLQPAAATSEDVSAVPKLVFTSALEQWEKQALPTVLAPVVVITTASSSSKRYSLVPPSSLAAAPLADETEEKVAKVVSQLLKLPTVHLPSLLGTLAENFAAAEASVAAQIEKIRLEEEKKKKAEEEAVKKALASVASGAAKKDKKDKKKDDAPREMPVNTLLNPHTDTLGAVMQYISSNATDYAHGLVITGLPAHDPAATESLAATLTAAGKPPVLNLHVEGSDYYDSNSNPGSAKPSINVAERLLNSARARRDSITPRAQPNTSSHRPRLTAHSSDGILGAVVRVEGEHQRLAHHAHALSHMTGQSLEQLLQEPLASTLLREGILAADPTDDPALHQPAPEIAEKEAKAGPPNAFSISLFCLSSQHDSRFLDLLAGAFEAYPDREYAVLTQPFSAPDIPLLRRFVQVQPLPRSTLGHTLYICHRESLIAPALAKVRRATSADRSAIAALVGPVPDCSAFMDAVVASERRVHMPLSSQPGGGFGYGGRGQQHSGPCARIATFVAEVEGQVVAAMVLSSTGASDSAVEAAVLSFQLDKHIEPNSYLSTSPASASSTGTSVASLTHVSCNPIFMPSAPFFLRQAANLYGGRSALLYRLPSSALGPHVSSPLPVAVRHTFALVQPRHMPELSPSDARRRDADLQAAASTDDGEGPIANDGVSYAAHTVVGMTDSALADPRSLDHALYVFSTRGSGIPTTTVNNRIVVVGASDAALSAVATLLLKQGVSMPHITLVSPGGLPAPCDYFSNPAPFTPGREFKSFELSRLPLSSLVRVVDDVLVRVNRKEKTVGLAASRSILRYDQLLLLPGLTESTWSRLGFEGPDRLPRGMHCLTYAEALGPLTADVEALTSILADDPVASAVAAGATEEESLDDPAQVVVYGESLEALTAISSLISRGIPGHKILHLRPTALNTLVAAGGSGASVSGRSKPLDAPVSVGDLGAGPSVRSIDTIADEQLLESLLPKPPAPVSDASLFPARAVSSILEQLGVRQIAGAVILGVNGTAEDGELQVDEDGQPLITIPGLTIEARIRVKMLRPPPESEEEKKDELEEQPSFEESKELEALPEPPAPTSEVVVLRAALLLCADERDVDPRFFRAVNDCGVVYDGRLVVDHRFVATDPSIYGGGSVAKFSRKYRAALALQKFDSREVGAAVAASVLTDLDATSGVASDAAVLDGKAASLAALLPRFSRPKAVRALLPGGLHYVSARLPLYDIGVTGKEISSHVDARGDGSGLRHCRVVLSRFGRVAELTYIGTDAIEADNLIAVVGHAASYLNGLDRRAEQGELEDLISFLRGDWATALFHDRFGSLIANLRELLSTDAHLMKLQAEAEALLRAAAESEDVAPQVQAIMKSGSGVAGAAVPGVTRRTIEKAVIRFLAENRKILPAYLVPALASV